MCLVNWATLTKKTRETGSIRLRECSSVRWVVTASSGREMSCTAPSRPSRPPSSPSQTHQDHSPLVIAAISPSANQACLNFKSCLQSTNVGFRPGHILRPILNSFYPYGTYTHLSYGRAQVMFNEYSMSTTHIGDSQLLLPHHSHQESLPNSLKGRNNRSLSEARGMDRV